MRLGIATIGNEVVKGRTLDTNFNYISDYFTKKGRIVELHVSCRDDANSICNALKFIMSSCDVIITTGGLGPTMDDITIASIAGCLGLQLVQDSISLDEMKERYGRQKLEITPEREKMTYLPVGAVPIKNKVGSAPGMMLKTDKFTIFSLPGVPTEMKGMLETVNELIGQNNESYVSMEFTIKGIMESSLAPMVKDIYKRLNNDIFIKTHPVSFDEGNSELVLEIYGYGDDRNELLERIEMTRKELKHEIKIIFDKDI